MENKIKTDVSGLYAVLPINVRLDNSLSLGSRIIFSEFTSYGNPCYTNFNALAEIFNMTTVEIEDYVEELCRKKYISIKDLDNIKEITYKEF